MRSFAKLNSNLPWLSAYFWQRLKRRWLRIDGGHIIFCIADHFEPSIVPGDGFARADRHEQERRLEVWCHEIPKTLHKWRDSEGRPFCHTYFYPAEQYEESLIDRLANHCGAGWGEIEIHLHHGRNAPDTPENTDKQLRQFRDVLAKKHGCLSQWNGEGPARYAFVHGNFALANSKNGRGCGVDSEMQILADTGCYADFTLPAAPSVSQVAKINSLYECTLPLDQRAPHRRGRNLHVGRLPRIFPLIVQGPLMLDYFRTDRRHFFLPRLENAALTSLHPPTMNRLELWRRAGIVVKGRPDWLFIKLHCHGMDPRDAEAMYGGSMQAFLRELMEESKRTGRYHVHFTTAREMVNIILAACEGREGNPGDYRDYRLKLIKSRGATKSPSPEMGVLMRPAK